MVEKYKARATFKILMADDDSDDREMTQEAFAENNLENEIAFVEDGEELLEYLKRSGRYANSKHEMPDLILLDLNMPRKDGREALREIKENPELSRIPVVILTTSSAHEDVLRTYNLGGNSFITKPVTFAELVKVTEGIGKYWFELVRIP
ncbi:MAG: response regulator [Bacteroidota bacterium]